jgi:hypothetical protein
VGGAQEIAKTSPRYPLAATKSIQCRDRGRVRGRGRRPVRSPFLVDLFVLRWILGRILGGGRVRVLGCSISWVWSLGDGATEQMVTPLDFSSAASPMAVLVGDRRTGLAFGIASGEVFGVFVGVVLIIEAGVLFGAGSAILLAAAAAIVMSYAVAGWLPYAMAHIWLALRHRLPWPLMAFLADAHHRGVLRQAGAVYQFRHIELQHRLANRP